jgi:hypothetical protein|nr:MAG TPA: hypothetical protein [Microviridae sp.]
MLINKGKYIWKIKINNSIFVKKQNMIKEKYEIEIYDITTNSISVYVQEATSFYKAFLAAKAMQRVYKNNWNRKTEILRIEKKYST